MKLRNVETRICGKCGELRLLTDFYIDRRCRRRDGRASACRFCEAERRDLKKNHVYNMDYRRTPQGRYGQLKGCAKKRGIEVLITIEEFSSLIADPCFYCSGALPEAGTGLDRLDSKGPYIMGNVVPCCTNCNKIKGNVLTKDEMLAVAALLKEMRAKERL